MQSTGTLIRSLTNNNNEDIFVIEDLNIRYYEILSGNSMKLILDNIVELFC